MITTTMNQQAQTQTYLHPLVTPPMICFLIPLPPIPPLHTLLYHPNPIRLLPTSPN
ncbi:hypothetical protein BofuT4_uP029680.1 [Botrytis cinerea T4]|uniref:Uncharacterized protein n=1 Tax=Botryotinia fuckeliana (strain T4) TaxID=999810 RepID=G2Y916_BOTF4|nr:hypothetical protein BofuT4_uP029680.1 [Botrytis cinerea T4]